MTGKTGERFPVTAVTSVTEAPVQPCEAVCAASSGWAGEVPATGEIGHVGLLWASLPEADGFEKNGRGRRDGETPIFRWGKHRVRLYAVPHSPGRSPGNPLPLKGRKERNAEEENGDHHSQDDAGG